MKRSKFVVALFIFLIFFAGFSLLFFLNGSKINPIPQPKLQGSSNNQGKVKSEMVSTKKENNQATSQDIVKVTRVIDGDTIEIEGGQKIRYIGIDTPETVHPDKTVQCFGKEASAKNSELVKGKSVTLEKDVSETDKYGRLLRYVYAGDIFVNDYLLRQGYAHSSSYPPDIKHQDELTQAEAQARENNRGLWAACLLDQSGSIGSSTAEMLSANGCIIKGNISSSKEKIYHLPSQRYYDKTQIDESKGESWFCTEEDAISAGFRKSKV